MPGRPPCSEEHGLRLNTNATILGHPFLATAKGQEGYDAIAQACACFGWAKRACFRYDRLLALKSNQRSVPSTRRTEPPCCHVCRIRGCEISLDAARIFI